MHSDQERPRLEEAIRATHKELRDIKDTWRNKYQAEAQRKDHNLTILKSSRGIEQGEQRKDLGGKVGRREGGAVRWFET